MKDEANGGDEDRSSESSGDNSKTVEDEVEEGDADSFDLTFCIEKLKGKPAMRCTKKLTDNVKGS